MEDIGLLGDILALLGAFFLGFLAGIAFRPLRRFASTLWSAPGQLFKGAQNVGTKLRQAFRSPIAEEGQDRTSWDGVLAGLVSDVLSFNVRRAEAAFREATEAFDQGDYTLARRKFSEAILWDRGVELRPLHVQAHLRLGWLDEERRAWDKAKEPYKRATQLDMDNLQAAVRLGMVHFRLGEVGPAIFQFQRALELDPANLDTHYYLYAIYRKANMEAEALEQLRIIKVGEHAEKLAALFRRHGEDHFRLGYYPEARADYELALQFDPRSIPCYLALGDLYYLDQQSHAALDTWCRGLWVDYSDALAERVLATAGETADIWAAITLIRDCLTRHPKDGRYYFLLSKLLRRAGEEEESRTLLEQAAYCTPQLLVAQEELGNEYSRVGQADKAAMAYHDGLRIACAQETVYRCQVCGYITKEEQLRCFQCNRWGTFEKMTRGEAEARLPAPRSLLERTNVVRQSLTSTWVKLTGRLLPGG
ncbi:MAG: tetratricopeptide repeat protein [Candidatus Hadarchaeum sp.]